MDNKWILKSNNQPNHGYKLFCIPYAGAGATVYRNWQQLFGEEINVIPIQLPGRENRMGEPLVDNVKDLAKQILKGIKNELTDHFSIFGHSMGGILAYELSILMEEEFGIYPDILFMSATTLTPRDESKIVSNKNDDELAAYLSKSGGTASELINNQSFREVYFPIIRNDYKLVEIYKSDLKITSAKILAFASYDDSEICYKDTQDINVVTKNYNISYFNGGHFFIQSSTEELINRIKKEIISICNEIV
jgi:surfactin synthase thioesterase subunit